MEGLKKSGDNLQLYIHRTASRYIPIQSQTFSVSVAKDSLGIVGTRGSMFEAKNIMFHTAKHERTFNAKELLGNSSILAAPPETALSSSFMGPKP